MATLAERLRKLREKIQRREKKARADRRAKARRIEQEDPEGLAETAQVKSKQIKESAQETKPEAEGLTSDTKQLFRSEFGISENQSSGFVNRANELIEDSGDRLDLDGDGDTDLLAVMDQPAQSELDTDTAADPVVDFSDDTNESVSPTDTLDEEIKF